MERWRGKVALVTGASVGIGAAVARHLAGLGVNVVGCARNLDMLNEVGASIAKSEKAATFTPIQCDVRDERAVLNVFDLIRAKYGRLDICVNNAGLAQLASLTEGDTEAWRLMLEVNVLGLSIVARESVRLMNEAQVGEGHIFNIGSLAGHRIPGDPATHFYSATKFAVRSLTEGLRRELRAQHRPIRVTLISPGIVETEFLPRFKQQSVDQAKEAFASMPAIQAPDIARIIENALALPAHVEVNDFLIRPRDQVN